MTKLVYKKTYSGFLYGEGKKDKKFIQSLISLEKFKFHTKKWNFNCGNASGSSPEIILNMCHKVTVNLAYEIIICFIDLDQLKNNYPNSWKMEKSRLEKKYSHFTIIWQLDNAEEEYRKVVGNSSSKKNQLNKIAIKKIKEFINSDLWDRILTPISEKEKHLQARSK